MPEFQRRQLVRTLSLGLGGMVLGVPCAPLWAQGTKKVTSLGPKLRIVIPANTRTALDHTGRALGDGLVGVGVCDEIEYENIDVKGGSTGLETYVKKYAADPNTFLVGGMALLSATAAYKSPTDITKVRPVARLTSASLVIVGAPWKVARVALTGPGEAEGSQRRGRPGILQEPCHSSEGRGGRLGATMTS